LILCINLPEALVGFASGKTIVSVCTWRRNSIYAFILCIRGQRYCTKRSQQSIIEVEIQQCERIWVNALGLIQGATTPRLDAHYGKNLGKVGLTKQNLHVH
jgi:hypothetical protein